MPLWACAIDYGTLKTGALSSGCGTRSAAQLGQKPCSATQASLTDRAVWVGPFENDGRFGEVELAPVIVVPPIHPR